MQYLKEAMPEMLRSGMEMLYSYAESGRHELAAAGITPLKDLAIYEEEVKEHPDDASAWHSHGFALGNRGRNEEALESFDRAVQIQPDDAFAWLGRGMALGRLGSYEEALESLEKAVEIGRAQSLKEVPEFASLLAAETEFLVSLGNLREENPGSARSALKNAIVNGKQAGEEDFQLLLFGYLKGVLPSARTEFAREAIGIIVSELGEDYGRLLRPFSVAIEYMETGDESILERLQQEERELVLEIAGQADAQQE
jgi:tetratricopeptide (TPR) repeat protein